MNADKRLTDARELWRNHNFFQATLAYEKLVVHFPKKSQVWYEYGCVAGGSGQIAVADQAWRKAVELEPNNAPLMLQIGHQSQGLRQSDAARRWFERAAAADPRGIDPRMALAILSEQNHRFAEARQAIESCLAIEPQDDQARYFSALLDRRENKLEDAERGLRTLIASNPRHQYVQYASRYELAEVLNRTERFDEAMQVLAEAKNLVRRLGDVESLLKEYDQEAGQYRRSTKELPSNILSMWAREFPERSREAIPKLAFLGGHPRSGTTLLEQILGAHPQVAALDEPRAFTLIAAQMFNASAQLSPARLNIIRRRYIDAIRRQCEGSTEGKLILDKNPSPTVKLRIWLRMFPELRVIIALRDPRDVVISCYFQNIPLNPINANFLSLERTAKHYANLMDVWLTVRQWEGFSWIETRYEDVVADLEKEGRRVNSFLGLEWDGAQERFYEKSGKKQMYSPTYHDASQPVYSRSIARWHAYAQHLTPILSFLEPYCRALGYS
ncbi:MAG TPA: sulfotransferase [Candidatus Saccharimonadales bacterium]|nr:sulfotransferase [Candidatus Saccharimonadales bacterium]